MYYESSDFLETADSDTLKQIARTRELTRKYYFSDYRDTEKRTSILRELLGGIGENVAIDTPFHCDYGKNIFLGNDVIVNMNWRQGIDCVKCADLYIFTPCLTTGKVCAGLEGTSDNIF